MSLSVRSAGNIHCQRARWMLRHISASGKKSERPSSKRVQNRDGTTTKYYVVSDTSNLTGELSESYLELDDLEPFSVSFISHGNKLCEQFIKTWTRGHVELIE